MEAALFRSDRNMTPAPTLASSACTVCTSPHTNTDGYCSPACERADVAPPRNSFPRDFHLPVLRGARRLSKGEVRRALQRRCAWLEGRIREARVKSLACGAFRDELRAIVQALELLSFHEGGGQ